MTGNAPVTETYILSSDSANLGCITTDTVLVTVQPLPFLELGSNALICPGDSVTFGADAGWDSYAWSTGDTGTTTTVDAAQMVSLTVQLGLCSASDSAQVTVATLPDLSGIAPSYSICQGDQVILNAGAPGDWSTGQYASSITVNTSSNITYTFNVQGCSASTSTVVNVIVPPLLELGPNITLCPNEVATLNAGNSWDNLTWSTGAQTNSIDVQSTGIYSVAATYQGCAASDDITVTTVQLPDLTALNTTLELCGDEYVVLHAVPGGIWSTGSTADSLVVSQSGTYTFSFNTNGCNTSGTSIVTIFDYPQITLSQSDSLCEGQQVTLYSTVSGQWSNGTIGTSTIITAPGTYVQAALNGPCSSAKSILVSQIALPTVDMPADTTVCAEQTLFLDVATPQSTNYLWSNGDSTSYSFLTPGTSYSVTASNACGTKSATINIDTYECMWNIYAPNAFTPNGDGINDSWEVEAFNVIDFSMSIYNRMGNLVYATHKLHEPWTPDAEKVGDDVYNYLITGVDRQGKPVSLTGHIVLVK